MEKQKLVHLEFLRIWAIFWVIFNHTENRGFFLFSVAENSFLYGFYLFLSIACKFAVPIFFMVSGALLLGKEENILTIFKKRVLKIAVVLVAASLFYYIFNCVRNGMPFQISDFLKGLYSGNISRPLWFLYAYLAILFMLPFLRKLVQNMSGKEYLYLAGMSILFVGIIPILQYRLTLDSYTINSHLQGALFTAIYMVYFLMGYFFEHVLPEKYYTWKNAFIGIVLSLICIGVCCYMTVFRAEIIGEYTQTFHSSLIAIPTYTVYFCVKLFFMKKNIHPRLQQFICIVGGTTFGIYLLEAALRQLTVGVYDKLQPIIRSLPACIIWILVISGIGFVISWFLKKIPGIRKFI